MVRIVTDSSADIDPELLEALQISVVPIYLRFGDKVYRDKIDISAEEFYHRLVEGPVHPSTSAPSPGDFAQVYESLAEETDEIISIHVSRHLSATYDAALQGKNLVGGKCRIEVIDSQWVSMALGLIDIMAAKKAQAGERLDEIIERVRLSIPRIKFIVSLDTPKYALKGGRLGQATGWLGAKLNIKPLVTLREGKISICGLARTRSKMMEKLQDFVNHSPKIKDLAVIHTTTPKEAESLVERLKSRLASKPYLTRLTPALGVHTGPGTLMVALEEESTELEQPKKFGNFLKSPFKLY
jgi:DegV family protein with EDD domain